MPSTMENPFSHSRIMSAIISGDHTGRTQYTSHDRVTAGLVWAAWMGERMWPKLRALTITLTLPILAGDSAQNRDCAVMRVVIDEDVLIAVAAKVSP